MGRGRLEAFSDGVLAIIITIMVLELKSPEGEGVVALLALAPIFLSYVLSFLYIGIYWNNHHHLLLAAVAYWILQQAIISNEGKNSLLHKAIGRDLKGRLSLLLYAVAVLAAFSATWLAQAIYVLVALIWIIPDRRIEQALMED